jgi:hypothetical protein
MWGWIGKSLDDTPPSDNVAPPLAHVHLLGRGLNFRSDRVACGGALSALLRCLLCKGCLRFFPLKTAPVVGRVVSPAATALGLFPRGRAPARVVGTPPQATHRGAYPQLRCVCPKRWQRLHCNGPFGATYDPTDTRKPQISVIARTFDTAGPRATNTMKWGVGGRSLAGT